MLIITAGEYYKNKAAITDAVKNQFKGEKIVVRSSSTNEDCMRKSNAGHYTSILDVYSDDSQQVTEAIDTVIESLSKIIALELVVP